MSGAGDRCNNSKSSNNGEGKEEEEAIIFVRKGSKVEVSSNDIGLRGVWFTATILEVMDDSSRSSSKNKKKKKKERETVVLVEYDNLLADDDENEFRLKEKVRISFIRPLPPPVSNFSNDNTKMMVYEKDDMVDAFHRDGWWVGVITRVIDEEEGVDVNYEVFFEDPPEFLTFDSSSLRLHLDWVQGRWIRPPKSRFSHSQSKSLLLLQDTEKHEVGALETGKVNRIKLHAKKSKVIGIRGGSLLAGCNKSYTTMVSQDKENTDGAKVVIERNNQKRKRGRPLQSPIVSAKRVALTDATAAEGKEESETNLNEDDDDDDVVISDPTPPLPGQQTEGMSSNSQRTMNNPTMCSGTGNINKHEASKKNKWPFTKRSPLWETIESTSTFQKTARSVHFSSLDKLEEESREGLAIGYVVTFCNMLENISKLVLTTDDRIASIIERYLGILSELEEHGFDVEAVRVLLHDLLSLKSKESDLHNESKEVHFRLAQCHLHKNKLTDKCSEIEAKLRKLLEEKQATEVEMDLKDQEIAGLKSKEELIKERVTVVNLDFQTRASTSPF